MPTTPSLLLASASPRRRRLLAWLGLPYQVCATETPEDMDGPLAADPPTLARSLAAEKATAARASSGADRAGAAGAAGEAPATGPAGKTADRPLVIACDTIVVLDGQVLGKPRDLGDAHRMLRALSGRTHEVVTGVALLWPGGDESETFAVTTPVQMRVLSDHDIAEWSATGELMGCAGAYNIESHLASVALDQCFQNVAGLPLCHLFAALRAGGVSDPRSPVCACDTARGVTCDLGPRLVAQYLSGEENDEAGPCSTM
jgi:septum formation protein